MLKHQAELKQQIFRLYGQNKGSSQRSNAKTTSMTKITIIIIIIKLNSAVKDQTLL